MFSRLRCSRRKCIRTSDQLNQCLSFCSSSEREKEKCYSTPWANIITMPGSATRREQSRAVQSEGVSASLLTHQWIDVSIVTAENDHRLFADHASTNVTFVVPSIQLTRFFKAERRMKTEQGEREGTDRVSTDPGASVVREHSPSDHW